MEASAEPTKFPLRNAATCEYNPQESEVFQFHFHPARFITSPGWRCHPSTLANPACVCADLTSVGAIVGEKGRDVEAEA